MSIVDRTWLACHTHCCIGISLWLNHHCLWQRSREGWNLSHREQHIDESQPPLLSPACSIVQYPLCYHQHTWQADMECALSWLAIQYNNQHISQVGLDFCTFDTTEVSQMAHIQTSNNGHIFPAHGMYTLVELDFINIWAVPDQNDWQAHMHCWTLDTDLSEHSSQKIRNWQWAT